MSAVFDLCECGEDIFGNHREKYTVFGHITIIFCNFVLSAILATMKRFVFWLRDFFLEYVLLIVIVGGVLGGIVWILARVFLWDTSTLSVSVESDVSVATLEIQARMIYGDATIFGTYYPFHVVFPWSQTVDCSDGQCVFEGVPHGDGSLTVSGEETRRSALFVAPDTRGVLDLRRPIRLRMV